MNEICGIQLIQIMKNAGSSEISRQTRLQLARREPDRRCGDWLVSLKVHTRRNVTVIEHKRIWETCFVTGYALWAGYDFRETEQALYPRAQHASFGHSQSRTVNPSNKKRWMRSLIGRYQRSARTV